MNIQPSKSEQTEVQKFSLDEVRGIVNSIVAETKAQHTIADSHFKIPDLVDKLDHSQMQILSSIVEQSDDIFSQFQKVHAAFSQPLDTEKKTQNLKSSTAELASVYIDELSDHYTRLVQSTNEYHIIPAAAYFSSLHNERTQRICKKESFDKIKITRLIEFLLSLSKYEKEVVEPIIGSIEQKHSEPAAIIKKQTANTHTEIVRLTEENMS